ncbi:MAG: glycosyltransferase family 2 protein [Bacillota bacterium]|nr:glycosyltransferase family 2 protein [Bacillota bacterium]
MAFRWLFVVTGLMLTYTYLLYPLIIWFVSCLKRPANQSVVDVEMPRVTILISAYNEETCIEDRIRNCLDLDYPKERLEILIGSDASTDRTDDIIARYADQGIGFLRMDKRTGKMGVINALVGKATGSILVLTDANTVFDPLCVRRLVGHFVDPRVGLVCGELRLLGEDGKPNGEGAYWRYEQFLKRHEGRMGWLAGANGGVYAMRRTLYMPPPTNTIVDDFAVTLNVLFQGYKAVYEPEALAWEKTSGFVSEEFRRKKRIAAGDFQILSRIKPSCLMRNPGAFFAFFSHKALRWMSPFFLIAFYASSIAMARQAVPRAVALLQTFVYAVAGAAALAERAGRRVPAPAYYAYYLTAMNYALLLGFLRFLFTALTPSWEKARPT